MNNDRKSKYLIVLINIDFLNIWMKNKPSSNDWNNDNTCSVKIGIFLFKSQLLLLLKIVLVDIKSPRII